MSLTLEQWKQVLNTLEPNNSNKGTILDQIKAKLQKQHQGIHEEWEKESFDENYLFNVSFTINNCQSREMLTLL
ncbi:hypothetical protein [Wolbachia endosymbiont of Ctenocephalides felis wCfeJ]|uniref:hypothetical protein n=1 Tax=Wolbachia endosymbiont of Ctenocephalides felis wCfeJ TaxID=2732594 RepID=UPI0014473458|nr:hypothetical protein [Wolbachia endosymbiont of Ctenocephalides felis wCfeJ]WCR58341.1 MAG: hypothetical protein PG980_000813 [Wolbachia endosymbiont of Ctenocephalides felis wCfeJ]